MSFLAPHRGARNLCASQRFLAALWAARNLWEAQRFLAPLERSE